MQNVDVGASLKWILLREMSDYIMSPNVSIALFVTLKRGSYKENLHRVNLWITNSKQ